MIEFHLAVAFRIPVTLSCLILETLLLNRAILIAIPFPFNCLWMASKPLYPSITFRETQAILATIVTSSSLQPHIASLLEGTHPHQGWAGPVFFSLWFFLTRVHCMRSLLFVNHVVKTFDVKRRTCWFLSDMAMIKNPLKNPGSGIQFRLIPKSCRQTNQQHMKT